MNLPSILTPDLGLLFWMALAFLVVLGFLAKYALPAIVGSVENRKRYIDDSLRKAHEASERLENVRQEGDAILQEAREKQAHILQEAGSARDAIVEKAQGQARDEGARLLSEARQQIDSERQNAMRQVRSQVVELSVQIAEKLLREKLSDNDQQMALIDRILDDIPQHKENN